MVLEIVPLTVASVLDLGTGDGWLLDLLHRDRPFMTAVGVDFSETMLEKARQRFLGQNWVSIEAHDLLDSISSFGRFDAVVSSFAIHHLEDDRKRGLLIEVFDSLKPGGVFCNLEHVASPTDRLHDEFLAKLGKTRETEDQSNRCSPVEAQLEWLRVAGFVDVDCYWKWRELAVLAGHKPK